jgi:Asparagine synthase
MLATRFYAFLPDANNCQSFQCEALTEFAGKARLQVLQSHSYFFACANYTSGKTDLSTHLVIDVFAGTAAACASITVEDSRDLDWPTLHDRLNRTVQVYNAMELQENKLRLESDFLGLKPVYMARSDGGTVLASSLADIADCFPHLINGGDELGIVEFFLFGTPLYGRTVHRHVERLQTGSCVEWRDGTLSISRERRFVPPPVESDLSISLATKRIRDTTMDIFVERIKCARTPVALGLSGGFDSRLITGIAHDKKVPLHAYSYGDSHHTESICSRAVAQRMGIPQTFLKYDSDSIFNGLPLYLQYVEGQADVMMVQITNLMQISDSEGATLLHGFLGDALSGAHLEWLVSPRPRTPDEVASDIVSHRMSRSEINGRSVAQVAGLSVSHDDLMHDIARHLSPDAEAHQNLILFDCENRQRRTVGSQLPMLGSRFHVITPNYDENVFASYFCLPRIALDDRYILRQVFARYWPNLAAIPHAEEGWPILPSLRTMLPFALRDYTHAVGRKVVGSDRYDGIRKRWRDPYLWRMSYGTGNPAQAQRIVNRIRDLRTLLDKFFGIRLNEQDAARIFPGPEMSVEPHFGRRLFALAEYGDHIESKLTARTEVCST